MAPCRRFEAFECVRRVLLASVIGLADTTSAAVPVIGLVLCLGFTPVFTALQPFKSRDNNTLSVILAYALCLIYLGALMIKMDAT